MFMLNFPNVNVSIACVADALNLLYGLYKWFRRVRGPAATQANVSSEEWCYANDVSYGIIVLLF